MADETGNLVLGLLRDIRGELADLRAKLDAHDKRFDRIDGKLVWRLGSPLHSFCTL